MDKIVAVATSAVREARNGEDLLDRIGRETGIFPKAISGEDEARLIYLAALHSIHLDGRRALVVDIGGGSLEMAAGSGPEADLVVSEKLGVIRLAEACVRSDPISAKDEKRLVRRIESAMEPHVQRLREAGFDCVVGMSGTILALGALAHEAETGRKIESLHHVTVAARTIHAVRKRLASSDLPERLRMKGLDQSRADIIVPGAILLDTLLGRLGVKELTLSTWALREGILLNYVRRHPVSLARAEAYPDVRRRSVIELAERCLYDKPHTGHVASLAVGLFDATRRIHCLGDRERSLLEHASLLHDVGHHIAHWKHHRHSEYMIRNGDLRGFDPTEIDLLASLARYHRQGKPRRKHAVFAALPPAARRSVKILAGILRVADSLDRSHHQRVRSISVFKRGGSMTLRCRSEGNVDLEFWGARRRAALLEEALRVKIRFVSVPAAAAASRAARARSL